jgi:hypothetical protein
MQTIQQNRSVQQRTERTQGRIKSQRSRLQKCASGTVAHDFLRHSFRPLLVQDENVPIIQAEQNFFTSLKNLESAYGLKETPLSLKPYPYNIMEAFQIVKEQVDKASEYEKLFLVRYGEYPYCLATAMAWDTGYHLYYIPFDALLQIMREKKLKNEANMMLSMCSYLSQVAGLPSYAKGDGVNCIYEQLGDWMEQESYGDDVEEQENQQNAFRELAIAKYYGKKIQKRIDHSFHLSAWEDRIKRYVPKDEKGREVKALAEKLFALYREYPQRQFYEQYQTNHWFSEYDSIMRADEYLSFIWSFDGWLGEQAYQYICDCSDSRDGMEEPLQFKIYDEPLGRMPENLDFEKRLFILVDELAYLINNYLP